MTTRDWLGVPTVGPRDATPEDACELCGGADYINQECPDCQGYGCPECGDTGTISEKCSCQNPREPDEYEPCPR